MGGEGELDNCLENGYHDDKFIDGEYAFWRLNAENGDALALMRIKIFDSFAVIRVIRSPINQMRNYSRSDTVIYINCANI